jgi:hypothetical protein
MHQQLWGYKVEWKSVSRGTGGKKVEYHWNRPSERPRRRWEDNIRKYYKEIGWEVVDWMHEGHPKKIVQAVRNIKCLPN